MVLSDVQLKELNAACDKVMLAVDDCRTNGGTIEEVRKAVLTLISQVAGTVEDR